jgi:hypothetical protein
LTFIANNLVSIVSWASERVFETLCARTQALDILMQRVQGWELLHQLPYAEHAIHGLWILVFIAIRRDFWSCFAVSMVGGTMRLYGMKQLNDNVVAISFF